LVFPIALALLFVEHKSIAASFWVISGCLTLVKYVTIDGIGIITIGLVLAKVLFDALPHVILFAKAVHVYCPITFLFGCVVSQIVLTRENDVFSILAHIVSITMHFVRILAVWFVCAKVLLFQISRISENIASGTLCRIAPITVFLGLVPNESIRTFGLEVNA
jgi:hypothetical protein